MLKVGTLIKVLNPKYAMGLQGKIVARESAERWIVKLQKNPLEDSDRPFLLSLGIADFQVIESESNN
jgi:hypothetical protein